MASIFITFQLQSKSFNFKFGHLWMIFEQTTKAIALLFGQKCLIFITFQSAIKINQVQSWSFLSHFWPNSKAIALVVCSHIIQRKPTLNLIDFDCRLKSDENSLMFGQKVRLILVIFLKNATKINDQVEI